MRECVRACVCVRVRAGTRGDARCPRVSQPREDPIRSPPHQPTKWKPANPDDTYVPALDIGVVTVVQHDLERGVRVDGSVRARCHGILKRHSEFEIVAVSGTPHARYDTV